jgi:two-component system OmpR family sensor kinase
VGASGAEGFSFVDASAHAGALRLPTYRGHDRRAPTAWATPGGRQLVLATALLLAVTALVVSLATTAPHPAGLDLAALNAVLATGCAALAVIAGFISGLRWRMVGNASSLRLGAALLVLSALITTAVLVPFVHPASRTDATLTRLSAALALTFVVVLTIAVVARPVNTRASAIGIASFVVLVAIVGFGFDWFVSAFDTLARSYRPRSPGGGELTAHVVVLSTWVVLGAIALARGLRRASWLWTWSGLMLFGFAGAAVLATLAESGDDLWSTGAYALRLLALLFVLNGVGQELKLAYLDQRARLFDTRLTVEEGEQRRRAELAEREERAHEARSALLGIQAATRQLADGYDDYGVLTRHELREALESEIRLLRSLVDADRSAEAEEFDVAGVVAPIVLCHRASGEPVDTDVPSGIRVAAHPAVVAEVVQTLLDNARDHAPGAPVVVSARRNGANAQLRVEDRGPGIDPDRAERIFERGESSSRTGSGLGLYVARRLLRDQGGDIRVEPRPGGGASFVVSVPIASLRTPVLPGAQLVYHTDHPGQLGQPEPLDALGGQQ